MGLPWGKHCTRGENNLKKSQEIPFKFPVNFPTVKTQGKKQAELKFLQISPLVPVLPQGFPDWLADQYN